MTITLGEIGGPESYNGEDLELAKFDRRTAKYMV